MTRTALACTSFAAIALTTVAVLPAQAATPAPQTNTSSTSTASVVPVSAFVSSLTAFGAEVTVKGAAPGALVTAYDGATTSTRRATSAGLAIFLFTVQPGMKYTYAFTQTTDAGTSDRTNLSVDTNITSVADPVVTRILAPDYDSFMMQIKARPGSTVTVRNSLGAIAGTQKIDEDGESFVKVTLRSPSGQIGPRFTLVATYGAASSSVVPFRTADATNPVTGDLGAPEITTTTQDGVVLIHAQVDSTSKATAVVVRDFSGRVIASDELRNGEADLRIQSLAGNASYRVSVTALVDGCVVESPGVDFVSNQGDGPLVPPKPVVGTPVVSGGSAVVSVTAAKGAIIRVRNSAGDLVALKQLGSDTTSAQVVVPVPKTRADGEFEITQERGAIESDPTQLELTA